MLWITLACIAGWIVTTAGLLRALASMHRAHGRREDLLLNQLLHATGRPWQPAPADAPRTAEERTYVPPGWTASPEQQPIDE